MNRRRDIHKVAGIAAAKEEQERIERLDEQGLCHWCEDRPQNPALVGSVCLDCFQKEQFMGCMVSGCPNSAHGNFRQQDLCEIHLTNTIHQAYLKYLQMKDDMQSIEEALDSRARELNVDPRNNDVPISSMSQEAHELYDDWIEFQMERQSVGALRAAIESSMKQLDEPFPEGYEIFG